MIPPPAQRAMSERAGRPWSSTAGQPRGLHLPARRDRRPDRDRGPGSCRLMLRPPRSRSSRVLSRSAERVPTPRSSRSSQADDRPRPRRLGRRLRLGRRDPAAAARGYPVDRRRPTRCAGCRRRAYVRSVLQTIDGPIVLVGHSYGGAVITNAAVGVPNVKALVYIAAFVPDQGETLGQLAAREPGSLIGDPTRSSRARTRCPVAAGHGPLPQAPRASATASPATSRGASRTRCGREQRPLAAAAFAEPSGEPGVEDRCLVVPRRHAGPRHPAGDPAVHGAARRRPRHAGARGARRDGVPARRDHEAHPRCRSRVIVDASEGVRAPVHRRRDRGAGREQTARPARAGARDVRHRHR